MVNELYVYADADESQLRSAELERRRLVHQVDFWGQEQGVPDF